jgi:hypothetical protein
MNIVRKVIYTYIVSCQNCLTTPKNEMPSEATAVAEAIDCGFKEVNLPSGRTVTLCAVCEEEYRKKESKFGKQVAQKLASFSNKRTKYSRRWK